MGAPDGSTAIMIHLAGGVALLIWAVRLVRTGAMRAFGPTLRHALASFTRNRFAALGSGAAVTVVLQSSTATTLLLSAFVAQALVSLPMAVAVALGANLGTAIAAFVVSLELGWLWGLLTAIGVALYLSNEAMEKARNIGRLLVGLGLILLSLIELKTAAAPLAQAPGLRTVLAALDGSPVIAVLVAVALTWATHSSIAVVLLVASFWSGGLLTPILAVTLIVGANLGNALVPVLDQLGAPPEQRRVAVANLITRVVLTLAVVPFAGPIAQALLALPGHDGRLAVELHVALNLIGAIVFLPFIDLLARAATKLLPDRATVSEDRRPRYLDPNVLDSPTEALACAMRETLRLGDRVGGMLRDSLTLLEHDHLKLSREIAAADDGVDALHEAIKLYLVRLSRSELSESESRRLYEIITLNTNLEHIGDIIDKNLRELAEKKIRKGYRFSSEGEAEIRDFHARISDSLQLALNVLATRDIALARRLFDEKPGIRAAERRATDNHYERLRGGVAQSIETSSIHLDVLRDLKRIHGHVTAIAYPILEEAGELRESRLRRADAGSEMPLGKAAEA